MIKKLVLVVSFMVLSCALYAQINTWTDSQGVVHFSDNPHPGSKEIKIPEAQTFSPPVSNTVEPTQNLNNSNNSNNNAASGTNDKQSGKYTKIDIIQPINEATIRNNQGYVVVSVELVPNLAPGDELQMIFDGAPLGDPQPNLIFELSGIYRGSHTLAVSVVNGKGEALKTSESITIFMQRPRGAKLKDKEGVNAVKKGLQQG